VFARGEEKQIPRVARNDNEKGIVKDWSHPWKSFSKKT